MDFPIDFYFNKIQIKKFFNNYFIEKEDLLNQHRKFYSIFLKMNKLSLEKKKDFILEFIKIIKSKKTPSNAHRIMITQAYYYNPILYDLLGTKLSLKMFSFDFSISNKQSINNFKIKNNKFLINLGEIDYLKFHFENVLMVPIKTIILYRVNGKIRSYFPTFEKQWQHIKYFYSTQPSKKTIVKSNKDCLDISKKDIFHLDFFFITTTFQNDKIFLKRLKKIIKNEIKEIYDDQLFLSILPITIKINE